MTPPSAMCAQRLLLLSLLLSQYATAFGIGSVDADGQKRLRGGAGDRRLWTSDPSSSCAFGSVPDVYVSTEGTDDAASGTAEAPYRTIQYAVNQHKGTCATVRILPGLYQNEKYASDQNHYKSVVNLSGVTDLIITAQDPENPPLLQFDGPGGFVCSGSNPCSNIEISHLIIEGRNGDVTYDEAAAGRLDPPNRILGRGIAVWSGHHLYFHHLEVRGCPGSGIRVNKGDYVTISDNRVYDNTWWSPRAESAIVLAESVSVDNKNSTKMIMTRNTVHGNVNKIPYYNPNYAWDYSPIGGLDCGSYAACEAGLVEGCPWQCRYGKVSQDYIIDGQGVYVTRNSQTYFYGQFELSDNIAYDNGINGLVFHRTNNGSVKRNIVYNNGVVPRLDKPEPVVEDWHAGCAGKSRQPYSGLVVNNAKAVKLWSNNVSSRYDDDYAFKQEDDSGVPTPIEAGGNNKACRGLVDIDPDTIVRSVEDLSICIPTTGAPSASPTPTEGPTNLPTSAPTQAPTSIPNYVEIHCGGYCHLIQWPYNMHSIYASSTARTQCEASCDQSGDCRAFSLQLDYRPQANAGDMMCFLYKESEEPSPRVCANDPFNKRKCRYATTDGQFFITPAARDEFNVLGIEY